VLPVTVIIVSPSRPHAVVFDVVPRDNGLYDVVALLMFKYAELLVDWMEPEMVKVSAELTGPRTGLVSAPY
jgi:hypothetical protein